jgi:hypothetical protein
MNVINEIWTFVENPYLYKISELYKASLFALPPEAIHAEGLLYH